MTSPPRAASGLSLDVPVLEPALDFMRVLWRIEHNLQSRSKHMKTAMGVTGPQRLVLRIVDQYPGLTAGALARILRLHPSTMTGIVQRLVDQELIERLGDRADRRRVPLRVTRQARRHTRRSEGTIESAVAGVLSRMPPAHVGHARQVLTAIAAALEEA
jgi:DNA-binding MarR family transcriptional regulator